MNVRLLPYEVADGPHNMAADEVLLESSVERHIASLRFYGWSTATVSIGYFEPAGSHRANPRLSQLPWVRRATGGGTLVHHHEVTYATALPPDSLWQPAEPPIFAMHKVIAAALMELDVRGLDFHRDVRPGGEGLCFQRHTFGDVLCQASKVVGSAQRKHRRALLQQGGILLAQSPHTPSLPGLRELAGATLTPAQVAQAVAIQFSKATGWTVTPGDWTAVERQRTEGLAGSKYAAVAWNEKR